MHVDWQTIIALSIVAVAAAAVARRLWAQVAAFRAPRRRHSSPSARPMPPSSSPLIQVQLTPPAHLKRPPADES
ncbi:MAG: hypothetical protein JO250_13875 [Armatimonadetes bacterium]|nr:hypothetical protein [Armatimonadota bacterium]